MKLTAKLALSQLKVNRRRSMWTLAGIIICATMIMTVYGLGFGSGMDLGEQMMEGRASRLVFEGAISGLAVILSVMIMAVSVIVVSNAFRVSAGERANQFGILKSVGATKKQIQATVVYEALFLTSIGIPIGILLGLILQLIGVELVDAFLRSIDQPYEMRFILSWFALFAAIVVSFVTVIVSAWLPARVAAKIPAIDTIRGAKEVKVKKKKIRGVSLIRKVFGYEGVLAAVFLRRSSRNFRASVISISISLILFIVATSFLQMIQRSTEVMWDVDEAPISIQLRTHFVWDSELEEYTEMVTVDSEKVNQVTTELLSFLEEDESVIGFGDNSLYYGITIPRKMWTNELQNFRDEEWVTDEEFAEWFHVMLLAVDEATYAQLVEAAGAEMGDTLLLNHARYHLADGRRVELTPFRLVGETLTLDGREDVADREVFIGGELVRDEIPVHIRNWMSGSLRLIVPTLDTIQNVVWNIRTDNPNDAEKRVNTYFFEESGLQELGNVTVVNREAEIQYQLNLIRLLTTLTLGFVGLLIAIAFTNVVSTISENVRTRAKEFAVLQSVGMTTAGIKRMLQLEAVFCAIRALVIGVPLGVLGAYATYDQLAMATTFGFPMPWMQILISIVFVFGITWFTMYFAAKKLKHQNIIETIRGGGVSVKSL